MSGPAYFRKIPTMTVEQARRVLDEHGHERVTLLDVRQPEEYSESHLPGAILIPVGELHGRLEELDPGKPTLVYCRSGMRGGNGTAALLDAGFREVWNMEGGILAWNGQVAAGAPEAGMSWFEEARAPAEYVALAWILEAGAGVFYSRMAERFRASGTGDLFRTLASAEEGHKAALKDVYRRITGDEGDPVAPGEVEARDTMEGGVSLSEALAWAGRREAGDVLEFAVSMEVNAYDRYLKVARVVRDPVAREILERLVREEKAHLDRLLEAFLGRLK